MEDTIGYTSVICTFARSGTREGEDRAEELLRRLLRFYCGENEGGGGVERKALRSDSITFNAVVLGLARQAHMEYNKNISNFGGSNQQYDD